MIVFQNVPAQFKELLEKVKDKLNEIVITEIGNVVVQFVFVTKDEISQMNANFRGKEGPTDVLTFVYGAEPSEFGSNFEEESEPYAESYICTAVVEENAHKFGNSPEQEMITVLLHSILHMAGYDHEYGDVKAQEMFEKQEKYVLQLLGG